MRAGVGVMAVALLGAWAPTGVDARAAQAPTSTRAGASSPDTKADGPEGRALIERYCLGCHNGRAKAGGLVLDSADPAHVGGDSPMWEKVVRKLRGRLMPPSGQPRPDEVTYQAFLNSLETALDAEFAAHPNPGRPETFRRMNRAEYQNAIRDLLALDIDVSGFVPADDSAHGFDNIGGVFKLSPALMESYLTAAKRISRMAMGTAPSVIDEGQVYTVPRTVQQHDRIDGLGLGTRGGMLVTHQFPQNGEYSFRVDIGNTAITTEPHTLELTVDGAQVKTFTVDRIGSPRETLFFGDKDNFVEVRVAVSAGPHDIGVAFYRMPPAIPESILQPFEISTASNFGGNTNGGPGGFAPIVKGVTIGGPFGAAGPGDTPSRRRLLLCRPATAAQEPACARTTLSTLARRAFRRPVTDADLKPLMDFYAENRSGGDDFEAAIEKGVRRLLASPEFIFRVEADPVTSTASKGGAYRIGDVELASRLSFFLWSSIPDDRLIDLAAQGRLKEPAVLAREVRRMLMDPRSKTLTTNFASQWLQLRKLESSRPGADYGKNFDQSLKDGLREETELFVDSIVRDNRPAIELLTATYTFLNERVARHYGIREVQGSHFRRVSLPSESPRRGLLGHGSILTLTSQAIRTSPVSRGKYILETLMGTPPPEPPPNVPALTEGKPGTRPKTMRDRMAAHRANPVCSACHAMIDPLGFSLENFDPVGAWRDFDESLQNVDASGQLPDGSKFGGFTDFRALLTRRPDQLAATVTEKLLTYAVGRGLEYYDMPAIRTIVREAASDEYRLHALVLGVVNSYPFRMRAVSASASRPAVSAAR